MNLHKGCVHQGVHDGEKSEVPWRMKCLEIYFTDNPEGVLQNCDLLEKLAVDGLRLKSREIEQIFQNGDTLRILSLGSCNLKHH